MKKFRTVAAVVIMFFAVITGFACVIYNIDNRE